MHSPDPGHLISPIPRTLICNLLISLIALSVLPGSYMFFTLYVQILVVRLLFRLQWIRGLTTWEFMVNNFFFFSKVHRYGFSWYTLVSLECFLHPYAIDHPRDKRVLLPQLALLPFEETVGNAEMVCLYWQIFGRLSLGSCPVGCITCRSGWPLDISVFIFTFTPDTLTFIQKRNASVSLGQKIQWSLISFWFF